MPKTRRGSGYENQPNQMGRAGRVAGNIPGTIPRKKTKKSNRLRGMSPGEEAPTGVKTAPASSSTQAAASSQQHHHRVALRSQPVSCLSFGSDRRNVFPDHFFCHNCDIWESLPVKGHQLKRTSRRYACTANHTSSITPTTLKKSWSRDRPVYCYDMDNINVGRGHDADSCSSSSSEDESVPDTLVDNTSTNLTSTSAMLSPEQLEISRLRNALSKSEENCGGSNEKARQLKVEIRRLKRQLQAAREHRQDGGSLTDNIVKSMQQLVKQSGLRSQKIIGTAIAEAAHCVLDGVAGPFLLDMAKDIIRRDIFSPWKVAKLMDLNGGTINLHCIELLRQLETAGRRYYRGSILPCKAELQRIFAIIEHMADEKIPTELYSTEHGEAIRFNYEKATMALLNAFGLNDAAKERKVQMAFSFDGADLHKRTKFTMAGVKMTDPAAINPLTKLPMFDDVESAKCGKLKTMKYFSRPTKRMMLSTINSIRVERND